MFTCIIPEKGGERFASMRCKLNANGWHMHTQVWHNDANAQSISPSSSSSVQYHHPYQPVPMPFPIVRIVRTLCNRWMIRWGVLFECV